MQSWRVSESLETDLESVRRVVVRVVAGEVTITTGDVARIEVRRESGAEVDVRLNDGVLQVMQPDADTAPIQRLVKWLTEGSRHRCAVTITAPPEVTVDVTAVSAGVVVSGVRDGTRVKSVSGDVTLSDLGSRVDVKTVSGDVEAKGISAELKLSSVSGDMTVVDGSCRWVNAKSVSGEVLLDLDLDPSGAYDVSTVSGGVAVRTPADPNLLVDARSVSGDLVSDFGLRWETRPGRREVYSTVGTGGARLRVKTVSGDLRLVGGRAAA